MPRREGIDDPLDESRPDDEVRIQHGAIANTNKNRGGWMPQIWVNGRAHGDDWGRGHDRDSALQLAHETALDEAQRYTGDWKITIEPRDREPQAAPQSDAFAEAKAEAKRLDDESMRASRALRVLSGGGGRMNITPAHVRASPEWQAAKRESDAAFAALRAFNARFVRRFAKEIRQDRRARGR